MNYLAFHNILICPARRTAALLCAAVLGLGLAAPRTSAQTVSGPLPTSPKTPVPFQAPVFHSGGGPGATFPIDTTSAPYLDQLLNPLQNQLQGTPTELSSPTGLAPYTFTQIPSFLLGNYDPTRPPSGLQATGISAGVNIYYPNHFADGSAYSWAAPFVFLATGATTVTVDDSAAAPTPANGPATVSGFQTFSTSTGWVPVTDPNGTAPGPTTSPAAATATNDEYLRLPSGVPGSAVWTLVQPTAGNYSLYFHVPSDLPDSNGNPEVRDTAVVYAIAVRDAAGNVTLTTSATASQVEDNDTQFLAGPFQIASGGSVIVTLRRTTTRPLINDNNDVLVADSMTLQTTVGDVQSAPTAITRNRFPNEFSSTTHPLQYWGVFVPDGTPVTGAVNTTAPSGTTTTAQLNATATPDTTLDVFDPTGATAINQGNILLHTGNTTTDVNPPTATPNTTNPVRLIRQLVYFGRSDPTASVSSSVDDSAGAPAFTSFGGFPVNTQTTASAATASNGEYLKFGASEGLVANAGAAATWTVPAPAAGAGTSFFVYAHIPAAPTETGQTQVRTGAVYTVTAGGVTYGPVTISQQTQGTDALVALPIAGIQAAAGTPIVVKLYAVNNSTTAAPPANAVVVADSVTVSTGTGQGAIYCVDGFTGAVVWRFETPGSANGASSPVFASPAVARINVMVTPPVYSATGTVTTTAVYANRLVVIVGDNNGLVYCLDAIGNGDGTSNVNVLAKDANGNPIPNQPVTIPQPAYGALATPLAPGTLATTAAATAHVGTTGVYWIYRPDATRPKYISGTNQGKVKPVDPTTDLPVPAAFNTASPTVFVDPTVSTVPDTTTGALASNAKVYAGNSNGVLYALDALGVAINGTTPDGTVGTGATTSNTAFAATGDTFNVSQDLQTGLAVRIPTCQPVWWFSLRGVDPNGAENTSSADIESAPAIFVKATGTGAGTTYVPTVYIGSAHEQETTSNVGRLYALNGLYGPSGNGGRLNPVNNTPTAANYGGPGAYNYNVGQVPQISKTDTADWSFPDRNDTATTTNNPLAGYVHQSSNGVPRRALGNITGSPVVFTNTDDTVGVQTRLYFAANSGFEPTSDVPNPTSRPDETQTGRIWAVNLNGSVGHTTLSGNGGNVWAYPLANDPNSAAADVSNGNSLAEPVPPIGSFLHGTPAIGFVQFPNVTFSGDGSAYNPVDAVHTTGVNGLAVPMLYIGTRGVNDSSLYAVNIDGDETATTDQRTIYRVVTSDGSIYQSSPALITNATINNTGTGGTNNGNGGAVYAVAGNTMYDYSATPITNPIAGEAYPLIRLDREFVGIGPVSSPTLAGADVSDFSSAKLFLANQNTTGTTNTSAFTTLDTDWIYVGDSSSGFCRGLTPQDSSFGGIPLELNQIIPFDPQKAQAASLDKIIQTYLVPEAKKNSTSSLDALPVGLNAPLPVYEWGGNVYLRFTNAVPPNPPSGTNNLPDPKLFVYDTIQYPNVTAAASSAGPGSPIPFYTANGTTDESINFSLGDLDATVGSLAAQSRTQSVQPRLITTPSDGFVQETATSYPSFFTPNVTNLATTAGNRYLGTYIYVVGDDPFGSTPGARRRVLSVTQAVDEYDFVNTHQNGDLTDFTNYKYIGRVPGESGGATGGNLVTQYVNGQPTFNASSVIKPVDQPTFGILNPLGVRGGSVNLLTLGSTAAVPIGDGSGAGGDALGPFRGSTLPPPTLTSTVDPKTGATTTTTNTLNTDPYVLQALANGDAYPTAAPPSSSGVGVNPTQLANGANDPTGVSTPPVQAVVVTATGLIPDNSVGDNEEISAPATLSNGLVAGRYNGIGSNGLLGTGFGGYSLNVFDRSALFNLGQILHLKMTVPANALGAPATSRAGLSWNSNYGNAGGGTTGHSSVVNYLPWETPPNAYISGSPNASLDYPDIAAGNIVQNAQSLNGSSGGDLTSNSVTLPQAAAGTGSDPLASRTVYGDPVQIKITVPNHQPANQQLYQQPGSVKYTGSGEIPPVDENGTDLINHSGQAFPMGYITLQRLYVPGSGGRFSLQRPYRDVRIYTGVPVDMKTSIVNPTTDIGQVPAAFGVQTEQYTTANNPQIVNQLGLFTPYNPAFTNPNIINSYFKPLTVHNDSNVNLLNAHFDQKAQSFTAAGAPVQQTLHLYSDTDSLLSVLDGFDIYNTTGPHTGTLPAASASAPLVPEQSYLVRTSLDSDIFRAYGQNPLLASNFSTAYPGATFHKPLVGSDQPSTLTVPDAPESYVPGASLNSQPVPTLTTDPNNSGLPFKSVPFVSLAVPFGTPVGTYLTSPGNSLRLFEGLDTAAAAAYSLSPTAPGSSVPSILYPPKYGGAVGGIGGYTTGTLPPAVDSGDAGQPKDAKGYYEDIYNGNQPISTTGTQLSATVVEQRLTDGATYGAVPMIDASPAGKNAQGNAVSTPDFAPAAYRDFGTGSLSVYWTSNRNGGYGIFGANLPFTKDPLNNSAGIGYFMPFTPAAQWWNPFTPSLALGTNSGLSVTTTTTGTDYAFAVNVANANGAPYSNTLYSYPITTPGSGVLGTPIAVTPPSDMSQVKYGVKGLSTFGTAIKAADNSAYPSGLWAFWTANTRGRTALYYSPQSAWGTASTLLPVPAGLTAVSDASPLLITAPAVIDGSLTYTPTIEVTYSGTGPDGNADIYVSRYLPHSAASPNQLDLVPFPAVTEDLRAQGSTGWYQGRDTAWSRSGALNITVPVTSSTGTAPKSLLYDATTGKPLFTQAIYDKASGFLVLTGVFVPYATQPASGAKGTTNTVYVDAATGRIRFSPALITATQSFPTIRATFSPMARRLTIDTRADVGPVTFLDTAPKPNDAPNFGPVDASRRWTIWRKSGVAGVGSTATLYYKTQRLTFFLPNYTNPTTGTTTNAIAATTSAGANNTTLVTVLLSNVTLNGTDVTSKVDVDYERGRIYFPASLGAEGQVNVSVTYTPANTITTTNPNGTSTTVTNTDPTNAVQWQDEAPANVLGTPTDPLPTDTASGLDTVIDTLVPIQTAANENNVAAFLDPFASATSPHKVWLFWNSTRNGTADIYSETIDPRFAPSPTAQ